ncbi:UNVERIFIED_CONTAM: hypothetical protein PYX00_000329 [Menopon gallinae]|uniref:Methyltransferase-like protein 4 n=1 Tax=Menopon gallinae TaxID=328185 RepID=A0AAW2IA20_9NEOP
MAVIASNSQGWIICHETYIKKVYCKTKHNESLCSYEFNPALFDICEPFRKSKNQNQDSDTEVNVVEAAYKSLYELFVINESSEKASNTEARKIANNFYDNIRYPDGSLRGENDNDEAVLETVGNDKYLFPKKCIFYSYDIKDINIHLKDALYHFILLDPPWWNKFIRRKRKANSNFGYNMMYDIDLQHIPINQLLHDDGLVGIWCTNAPSHINAVLTKIFPAWNIKFLSQWFWLKITKDGKPICAFSEPHGKHPYERIMFGVKQNSVRQYSNPENNKVFMSAPSAIHSHKPPVCELLKDCIPQNANCLELFARYLLPHWTSYGNEVLKLQHFSLYTSVTNK